MLAAIWPPFFGPLRSCGLRHHHFALDLSKKSARFAAAYFLDVILYLSIVKRVVDCVGVEGHSRAA